MDANMLEAVGSGLGIAGGLWALVRWSGDRRTNGHGPAAPPDSAAQRQIAQSLGELLLDPLTGRLDQLIDLQALQAAPEPPPAAVASFDVEAAFEQWSAGLIESEKRLMGEIAAKPVPEPAWPAEIAASFERMAKQMEALVEKEPDPAWRATLTELAELIRPLAQIPRGLEGGFERLSTQLADLLAAERNRTARSAAPAGNAKATTGGSSGNPEAGGGATDPPPRPVPRALPRLPSGTLPITPQIPAPYVPGSVWVPAGEVSNLLVLIQHQLSPNCPGTAVEFLMAADSANSGPILVGGASTIGGPLSATNYAYQLAPDSPPRIYRSSYPGSNTPVGELQVLSADGGYLHVEVQT